VRMHALLLVLARILYSTRSVGYRQQSATKAALGQVAGGGGTAGGGRAEGDGRRRCDRGDAVAGAAAGKVIFLKCVGLGGEGNRMPGMNFLNLLGCTIHSSINQRI
jgi:hypothetical protein